jgi:uncharacterized membrane protein
MMYVHIVPVGENWKIILDSMKMYEKPVQKAYFILSEENENAHRSIKSLETALKDSTRIEKVYINGKDLYSTALKILEIIVQEKRAGNCVYVNLSDVTTKELCLACLLSAQISKSNVYMAISPNKIVDIPLPLPKPIRDDKIHILKTIDENGGEVESIDQLIELMCGTINDKKTYLAWRAKLSYHLKSLEKLNLVKTFKNGRFLHVQLTPWGKAYLILYLY